MTQPTEREQALVEAARECCHEPIRTGDWCFRGLCRHCGYDTLSQYKEPTNGR